MVQKLSFSVDIGGPEKSEKCKKSKEISEVLIKHDIKSCIKVK